MRSGATAIILPQLCKALDSNRDQLKHFKSKTESRPLTISFKLLRRLVQIRAFTEPYFQRPTTTSDRVGKEEQKQQ